MADRRLTTKSKSYLGRKIRKYHHDRPFGQACLDSLAVRLYHRNLCHLSDRAGLAGLVSRLGNRRANREGQAGPVLLCDQVSLLDPEVRPCLVVQEC